MAGYRFGSRSVERGDEGQWLIKVSSFVFKVPSWEQNAKPRNAKPETKRVDQIQMSLKPEFRIYKNVDHY